MLTYFILLSYLAILFSDSILGIIFAIALVVFTIKTFKSYGKSNL